MFPKPVTHILIAYLRKVFKSHGQIGLLRLQKVTFPLFRLSLQLKAPFLLLFLGSGVIGRCNRICSTRILSLRHSMLA